MKKTVCFWAASLLISSTASAALIQIDFTGEINFVYERQVSQGLAVGDAVTGRFVLDESVMESLKSYGSGEFSESTSYGSFQNPFSWISSSITVGEQTFVPRDVAKYHYALVENSFSPIVQDQVYVAQFGVDYLPDSIEQTEFFIEGFHDYTRSDATDFSDFDALEDLFTRFVFLDSTFTLETDVAYYTFFEGLVSSVEITRITSIPEPSTISLMLLGAAGLLVARLKCQRLS